MGLLIREFLLLMGFGIVVSGNVFLAGLIAAAIALGNHAALYLALSSAGATYLSYCAHFAWPLSRIAVYAVWLSVVLGVLAGAALLLR